MKAIVKSASAREAVRTARVIHFFGSGLFCIVIGMVGFFVSFHPPSFVLVCGVWVFLFAPVIMRPMSSIFAVSAVMVPMICPS